MGKIGDLWVRLGLHNEEFKKGMEESQRETENFGSKLGGLKVAALAAWAAIGTAFAKVASDLVRSTQMFGDRWNETMAGLKASYHSFITSIASGEGWRQLFDNMREASRLAKEAAKSLDEVFERKMSFNIQASDINRQIAEQRQIMMDSARSDAERIAASKKIIELEKELGKVKKDIWTQEANARRDDLSSNTGLSAAQIKYLVDDYNKNREQIQKSYDYLAKRSDLVGAVRIAKANDRATGETSTATLDAERALRNFDSTTDLNTRRIAKWVEMYQKGSDEYVEAYARAVAGISDVETEIINGTTRANSFLGRHTSGSASGNSKTDEIISSMLGDLDLMQKYNNGKIEVDFPIVLKPDFKLDNDSSYFSILGEGIDEYNALFEEMANTITEQFEELDAKCAELAEDFKLSVVDGYANGIQTLMDGMMGLEQLNAGSVLQALLEPLADLAIQQGKITMLQGVAIEAIGKSLKSLNGGAAIAAGAALIAVGAAAKAGLASLANSMGGSGASASSATTASASTTNSVTSEEIVVRVEGKISGNDILISGERTRNNWNR